MQKVVDLKCVLYIMRPPQRDKAVSGLAEERVKDKIIELNQVFTLNVSRKIY